MMTMSSQFILTCYEGIVRYTLAWPELAPKLDCRRYCLWARATRASLGVEDQHECAENSYHAPDFFILLPPHSSRAAM